MDNAINRNIMKHRCRLIIGVASALILVGCNPSLRAVSLDHPTHRDMINAELNSQYGIVLGQGNSLPESTYIPFDSLRSYCNRDGGSFQQIEEDKDILHAGMKAASGYFSCSDTNAPLWKVQIDVWRGKAINGNQGYYMEIRDVPLSN